MDFSSSSRNRNFRKLRKVLARLRRKEQRGAVGIAYPVVRKMFRVEKPWEFYSKEISFRQKSGHVGAGHARHWARESLSQRFVQGDTLVDPNQDLVGQARQLIRSDPASGNTGEIQGDVRVRRPGLDSGLAASGPRLSRFSRLVGNPKYRKKFLKVCRGILQDLGLSLVGPLPMRALEIMWAYFGEEHFSAHGRACWCQLCRSIGPARISFLQAIGDSLYNFFVSWGFALNATFSLIAPAPLKMAKFVANKLWKWYKRLYRE